MIFYTRFVWIKKKKDQKVHCCFTQNQNNWVLRIKSSWWIIIGEQRSYFEIQGLFLPKVVYMNNWSWHQNRTMKLSPHFGYYVDKEKTEKICALLYNFTKMGAKDFQYIFIEVWRTFLRYNLSKILKFIKLNIFR